MEAHVAVAGGSQYSELPRRLQVFVTPWPTGVRWILQARVAVAPSDGPRAAVYWPLVT